MKNRLLAAAILFSVAAPAALAAMIAPIEYRECMKDAIERRERGYIDSLLIYNDDHVRALEERRVRYVEAYDADTDAEIRDRTREADKHYGRAMRSAKELKRDRDDVVRDEYNDHRRFCKDIRRDVERGERPGQDCDGRVCFR